MVTRHDGSPKKGWEMEADIGLSRIKCGHRSYTVAAALNPGNVSTMRW